MMMMMMMTATTATTQEQQAITTTLYPLTMSLCAGLATTLGALLALLLPTTTATTTTTTASLATHRRQEEQDHEVSPNNTKTCMMMSGSLALAGSVMMTVTVVSIVPECWHNMVEQQDQQQVVMLLWWWWFVAGGALYAVLARIVEAGEQQLPETWLALDQHHYATQQDDKVSMNFPAANPNNLALASSSSSKAWLYAEENDDRRRAWRMTLVLFGTLFLHNFPEGLVVAASAVHSTKLGQTTAVAIALHNIPEGLAIEVPCLVARPEAPWLAVGLASLSGLAEPLGAWVTLTFWQQSSDMNSGFLPQVLAMVGGIMSAVACGELFPQAWWYATKSRNYMPFVVGTVAGVALMICTESVLAELFLFVF